MGLRQKIKVILNEALGVPDDIDIIVNIYTDLIINKIKTKVQMEKPLQNEETNKATLRMQKGKS